jgi:hypothetical protein
VRVDAFGAGVGGACLLAVAWMLWKGGPFRTEPYAPLMFNSETVSEGSAALAAKTDGPARLPVISKIAIGALISNSKTFRYLLDAGACPPMRDSPPAAIIGHRPGRRIYACGLSLPYPEQ